MGNSLKLSKTSCESQATPWSPQPTMYISADLIGDHVRGMGIQNALDHKRWYIITLMRQYCKSIFQSGLKCMEVTAFRPQPFKNRKSPGVILLRASRVQFARNLLLLSNGGGSDVGNVQN